MRRQHPSGKKRKTDLVAGAVGTKVAACAHRKLLHQVHLELPRVSVHGREWKRLGCRIRNKYRNKRPICVHREEFSKRRAHLLHGGVVVVEDGRGKHGVGALSKSMCDIRNDLTSQTTQHPSHSAVCISRTEAHSAHRLQGVVQVGSVAGAAGRDDGHGDGAADGL